MSDAISSGGCRAAYEKEEQEEEMDLTTGYLPTDTPLAIGSTIKGIKTVVASELAKNNPPPYVLFSNVPPDIINPSNDFQVPGLKDHIKGVSLYFAREIMEATSAMGLKRDLMLLGAATVAEQGVSTEPDASFSPSNLPVGRDPKWPSVVVKTGNSETSRRLHADAQLWISRSRGQVKAVILISFGRDVEKIIFEMFVPNYTPLRSVRASRRPVVYAICQQKVAVTRSQGQVAVTGAPLIITFEEMFLRSPNPPNERDYVLGQQELTEISDDSWSN